jgi:hypothetical protein
MYNIHLQPKQGVLLDLIEHHRATVIGVGGGRGAAKSGGADRIGLAMMMERPGLVACIVMRNYDQVRKYHVEAMLRDFPVLEQYYRKTDSKLKIPVGGKYSELDFSYAESLEDVKRRFRSGNYDIIIVDQAEQFTWEELSEMGLAARSKQGRAKVVLLFNMGGIGILDLRNRFGPVKKFNDNEDPEDYAFLHVFPWDNVEWSRAELESSGLTEDDYYSWTDEERFSYFTTRSAYGRKLNALDDATRARDLLGGWESLEGAYFGRVFDYKATMKSAEVAEGIIRPWDSRWLSTDWGKSHFCSTHWHGKSLLSPSEVKKWLGWDVPRALNVVSTYRRMIVNEMTSSEVAAGLIEKTPKIERERLQRYPFSPEQFGERDSEDTVPIIIGRELAKYGMPHPEVADNSRKPGWQLMSELLNNTRIWATPQEQRTAEMEAEAGDTVWIISSECPEALETIPVLMRNVKDLDDVVKTDKGMAVMAMDVADDLRYGLQSMLGSGRKPDKVVHGEQQMERLQRSDYQSAYMAEITFRAQQNGPQFQVSGRVRRR